MTAAAAVAAAAGVVAPAAAAAAAAASATSTTTAANATEASSRGVRHRPSPLSRGNCLRRSGYSSLSLVATAATAAAREQWSAGIAAVVASISVRVGAEHLQHEAALAQPHRVDEPVGVVPGAAVRERVGPLRVRVSLVNRRDRLRGQCE